MKSMNLGSLALAGALGLGSVGAQARDCTPESKGYVPGVFSDVCAVLVKGDQKFVTQAAFTKARVAGEDTGNLKLDKLSPTVHDVQKAVLLKLQNQISEEGLSPIDTATVTANIRGVLNVASSPDVNLDNGTLSRKDGRSPTHLLYRASAENKATAKMRCDAILAAIPQVVNSNGRSVNITTNGLTCNPSVRVFNEPEWAVRLTMLGNEIIDKGLANSVDDAQILGIKMANNTSEVSRVLSPASLKTISELTAKLQEMRTIDINGTLSTSMLVNKQEYNWGTIGGSLAVILAAAAFYAVARRRRENTGHQLQYSR